jgi:ribosome-associated protein
MNQAHTQPAPAGVAVPVVGSGPVVAGVPIAPTGDPLLDIVLQSLDDDQAQDVVTIPLEGKTTIADYMVIASGRSTRQVATMAQKLSERIKHAGHGNSRIEGLPVADWVLVDASGVIIHLFRPEVRSFYNLERMWGFDVTPAAVGAA